MIGETINKAQYTADIDLTLEVWYYLTVNTSRLHYKDQRVKVEQDKNRYLPWESHGTYVKVKVFTCPRH
jgi:hypothetical protein